MTRPISTAMGHPRCVQHHMPGHDQRSANEKRGPCTALSRLASFVRGPQTRATRYPTGKISTPVDLSRPSRSDPTHQLHMAVARLDYAAFIKAVNNKGWYDTDDRLPRAKSLAHRLAAADPASGAFSPTAWHIFSKTDWYGQRVDLNVWDWHGDSAMHTALKHGNVKFFKELSAAISADPTIDLDLDITNLRGQTVWDLVRRSKGGYEIFEHLMNIRDVKAAEHRAASSRSATQP